MCRSPTIPDVASPVAARSTSIATSAPSRAVGYSGHVWLEYVPTTTTIDSLRWLRQEKVIPL